MIKERNLITCVILSIITCGFYGIYWFFKITNETNELTDSTTANGGLAFLYTLLTCGIYGFYWAFKMGEKVGKLKQQRGIAGADDSVLFLILTIVGLGIIVYILTQSELNNHAQVQ